MKKKLSGSSALGKRRVKSAKHMPDKEIDFSEIPESTSKELKEARRVGRPRSPSSKQLVAIRLTPKLLLALKKLASKRKKPYQTLMQELLEDAVRRGA